MVNKLGERRLHVRNCSELQEGMIAVELALLGTSKKFLLEYHQVPLLGTASFRKDLTRFSPLSKLHTLFLYVRCACTRMIVIWKWLTVHVVY